MGQQWMELQAWIFPQRHFRENLGLGEGGEEGRDNDIVRATFERTGVSVMGKRMFDAGEEMWPENPPFFIPDAALTHFRRAVERGTRAEAAWTSRYSAYAQAFPDLARELEQVIAGDMPANWDEDIPVFPADDKGIATRVASGKVMNAIAPRMPALIGGSADLDQSLDLDASRVDAVVAHLGDQLRLHRGEHALHGVGRDGVEVGRERADLLVHRVGHEQADRREDPGEGRDEDASDADRLRQASDVRRAGAAERDGRVLTRITAPCEADEPHRVLHVEVDDAVHGCRGLRDRATQGVRDRRQRRFRV